MNEEIVLTEVSRLYQETKMDEAQFIAMLAMRYRVSFTAMGVERAVAKAVEVYNEAKKQLGVKNA